MAAPHEEELGKEERAHESDMAAHQRQNEEKEEKQYKGEVEDDDIMARIAAHQQQVEDKKDKADEGGVYAHTIDFRMEHAFAARQREVAQEEKTERVKAELQNKAYNKKLEKKLEAER